MIVLNLETISGCDQEEINKNIPLEDYCYSCNYWSRSGCPLCGETGYVLNKNGERLLEFMRKYLLTGERNKL